MSLEALGFGDEHRQVKKASPACAQNARLPVGCWKRGVYFLLTEVNEQPRKTQCVAARPHQTSTAYSTLFLFLKGN